MLNKILICWFWVDVTTKALNYYFWTASYKFFRVLFSFLGALKGLQVQVTLPGSAPAKTVICIFKLYAFSGPNVLVGGIFPLPIFYIGTFLYSFYLICTLG